MLKYVRICMGVLPWLVASVQAQTAPAAREDFQVLVWAASCTACHGTDGRAEGTGMTIGGGNEQLLAKGLLEFKNGLRAGTIMQQLVKGYSDEELRRIAQYFSQLK